MTTLKHHHRYDYSAVADRDDYRWPDGSRLAVYIGLNLEHFAFGTGLGGELVPAVPARGNQVDVLNYAWRDYGNRVGVWRLLALFDRLALPTSLLLNSTIYDYCPQVVDAFRARGDEIVGHGRSNSERQGELSEDDERALIDETSEAIRRHEGAAPAGWLGPWISQSRVTPDLLAEAGYRYLLDWCHDDRPTWFRTRNGGRILSLPYPQELNDIPAIMVRRASADTFAQMIIDNFDEMFDQAARQPLVMGIALHPYIVGQPFRLRQLRRALSHIAERRERIWLTTAGAIADASYRRDDGAKR